MKDYYKILGLKFDAKEKDIKRSYRTLAQKYHPDKNYGNKKYDDLFKEINEAYSVLSDRVKKSSYDLKYSEYFFENSSYTNANHTHTSSGNNTDTNNKEESSENTKTYNHQANSMNKETFGDKTRFYNNNIFKFTLLLSVIVIGILIIKWKDIAAYYDEKDKKEQKEKLITTVQKTKKFTESAIPALKIPRITLETRWKDSLMYFKFNLIANEKEGEYNKYNLILIDTIKNAPYFETRVKTIDKININFLDKDGFKIYTLNIPISDMTRILDSNGNAIAYSINSNIAMKPELYKDFESWELTYTSN